MKVRELIELLSGIEDGDMEVVMPHGEDHFLSICRDNSGLMDIPVPDESEQGYTFETVAVLFPCTCDVELPVQVDPDRSLN